MKPLTLLVSPLLIAVALAADPPRSPQKVAKQPPDPRIAALQLPQVNFREVDFNGALEYFRRKAEQQTNGTLKLTFVQDVPKDFQPKHELSLALTNIPFTVALNYLAELAGVQFAIDGTTITARSLTPDAPTSTTASTENSPPPAPEATVPPDKPESRPRPAGPPVTLPVVRAQLLSLLAESQKAAESKEATPEERAALHDAHRTQLRRILQTHGWPGRDLVGTDGSQAALNLLQEECEAAELMKLALPLLQVAVQHQTAALSDLARLIDADRVGSARMQVYGTQYRAALDGQPVRFPIEDLAQVDARRRLAGLPSLRAQEEAMGLVLPLPNSAASPQNSRKPPVPTRLQMAAGLNSVESPMLNWVYVHSRDSKQAAAGGHPAGGGLDTRGLSGPKK